MKNIWQATFCQSVQIFCREKEKEQNNGNCKAFCVKHKRKKCKKTKNRNHLNQEGLHKSVRSIEINLEDFSQRIIQIACIRSFIKS